MPERLTVGTATRQLTSVCCARRLKKARVFCRRPTWTRLVCRCATIRPFAVAEKKKNNTPCVVQATHLRNVVVESVGGTGRGALRSEHWEGNPRCKIGKQHRSLWPQVSHYWYQGMGALLGNAPSHTHCINAPSHCHDKHYP